MDENIIEEQPQQPHKKERRGRFKSEFYDWGEALVVSLTVVILVFVFLVRLIGVDGHSMEQTLHHQDQILMSNLFYTPKKGDIVVLTKKSFMDGPIVKRVIATEGDTVNVNYDTGEVSVNGEILEEPYINEPVSRRNVGDVQFPAVVPEGCVFVMGDNRNHSTDSRFSDVGMVDRRCILGHVLLRIFPFDRIGFIE